jgi:O-antigen ligase
MLVVAFFAIGFAQSLIAMLQWRTGSSLGLSFLGEESSLGIRTIDEGEVLRPTGTVVHPIFLAALVAPIGLIAMSLAIVLREQRWRVACGFMAAVAFVPLVLAQARASLLAAGITVALLVVAMIRAGKVAIKHVLIALAITGAVGLVFLEPIQQKFADNLGTSQFQLETEARLELNDVAFAMIRESPLVGLGLNQFETVQPTYDQYGLIFAGNPVHNIYLLVAAETGLIGLAGFLAIYVTAFVMALRSARTNDPLLVGVGVGITAALTYFALEELLSFALRQEMPLALFWILSGLAVACARMAGEAGSTPFREVTVDAR